MRQRIERLGDELSMAQANLAAEMSRLRWESQENAERSGKAVADYYKCRTRALVVGSDFEYLRGSYDCLYCNQSVSSLQRIGECLQCGHRFAGDQVANHELIGYHTNRLDPMSLLTEG